MLVLSRKPKQSVVIGDDIKVTVLSVKGNTVRMGIEAPDGVRIIREEIAARSPSFVPTNTPTQMPTEWFEPACG